MELVKNEFIILEEDAEIVFITVFKAGFTLLQINEILNEYPRVSITKFLPLKAALENAENVRIEIGEMKPLVGLFLSADQMLAKIRLNITEQELLENKEKYRSAILETLHKNHVNEGILVSSLQNDLVAQKDIVIARGIEPQNGADARLLYYKRSERKPSIKDDGKADFYDMNFIDEVKKGDWLGEKINATGGTPGKTVTGELLPPKSGKERNFLYDPQSVGEFSENGKVVLRALTDGVVEIKAGKISVGRHLTINEDVGVGTGNIEFDGSVTINGVILDGFSVRATNDISVTGDLGVSGIKEIVSLKGDIFIKGGVFGKGYSTIKAGKSIFVRHANECILEAEEDIHIGYYSIGSTIKGRNIIIDDQKKGKIIGGHTEAKGRVIAAILGNKMERKTIIQVEGFNREEMSKELESLLHDYKEGIIEIEKHRRKLDVFESFLDQLNEHQREEYQVVKSSFEKVFIRITKLDERRKSLMALLETKGEGQVSIEEVAYPETMLQIKNLNKRLNSSVKGTFYAMKNNLHFE
ncbi:FapA family protein [Cytobacillus spongiae]|uniref:DUF342 domain-containing protein n=1 Tax=Cytobacillus spongiae TaxID=2901381 RepID=UPI001F160D04|nr:FapA family protein [Cytobacillus spongiae]UII54789.1 FapA family protein [Cytobacillus spongiae]